MTDCQTFSAVSPHQQAPYSTIGYPGRQLDLRRREFRGCQSRFGVLRRGYRITDFGPGSGFGVKGLGIADWGPIRLGSEPALSGSRTGQAVRPESFLCGPLRPLRLDRQLLVENLPVVLRATTCRNLVFSETVARLQMIFSLSGWGLDDISERRVSWRYGHGWTWKLCCRSHRRHRAHRGSSPAADCQTVSQLSMTLLSPVRTPGVSASDGPSNAPRSGRPDVRAAAKAGGNLLAASLPPM